jgi:DNA-binding NarL/FixJ family response regulator
VIEREDEETYSRTNRNMTAPGSQSAAQASVQRDEISAESRQSQLSCLERGNGTILIGLIDIDSFTRECITGFLKGVDSTLDVLPFESCEDFLQCGRRFDLLLYQVNQQVEPSNIGNTTLLRLTTLAKTTPVIVLSPIESNDLLFKAFECGARGFISTASTPSKQVVEIIRFVTAGGTFVPPSSLALRMVDRWASTSMAIKSHQFTLRELAVLDRLRLGEANKAIAHALEVSESTVKVSIKSMMKKLSAKNRTEVVCRAYQLTTERVLAPNRL